MAKIEIPEHEQQLIQELEKVWLGCYKILFELHKNTSDRVQVAKYMLRKPLHKYGMTWDYIKLLNVDECKVLFYDILDCATDWNSPTQERAFNQILNEFPREWVLENLESTFRPLLEEYQDEAYRTLIYIYEQIDFDKAIYWAKIALSHDDQHIRLEGKDWLEEHNISVEND